MKPGETEHLGDGAYLHFDGYGFELRANHHEHPTDRVYIDWPCAPTLERLLRETREEAAKASESTDPTNKEELAAELAALNELRPGWTEARPGGMLCNPNQNGGIIDVSYSGKWFVVFNGPNGQLIEGFATRSDAIIAFAEVTVLGSVVSPSEPA